MKKRFTKTVSVLAISAALTASIANAAEEKPSAAPAQTTTHAEANSAFTADTFNGAQQTDKSGKGDISPAIFRAEVLLGRAHNSPGVIDGRDGANFEHALETYEKIHDLKVIKSLDAEVWSSLTASSEVPVAITYSLTDKDVEGPFFPDLPKDYSELAKLPTIGYRSPSQKIAALFHMSEGLLSALNPGVDLSKAGGQILVANIASKPLTDKVKTIIVDKTKSQVMGYDGKGQILVSYPATIGSQELPSPSGTYKVKGIAFNPVYYYDPDKNFVQGDNKEKLKLPPGPNNPVGSVFIALTKPTYGLHGSPDPEKIDKTASHGCVRMTNWDANELARLVKTGVVVSFKDQKTQ